MTYDLQHKINNDINLKKFLRENSYWYKELNRNIPYVYVPDQDEIKQLDEIAKRN